MRYAVVIEHQVGRWRAWVPDLPGCVAAGASIEELEREIRLAIRYHIARLRDDGIPVPPPNSRVDYVGVSP